jgi:hypothetical protein
MDYAILKKQFELKRKELKKQDRFKDGLKAKRLKIRKAILSGKIKL